MITQTIDPHYFDQKALRIRDHVSTVLAKWGLLPRFKRWRLAQDSSTGMIVLFGILNNKYIATPFSDYFDPRLLHDLAKELRVQVVSCNSNGLLYAFILDRGELDKLPTHVEVAAAMVNDQTLVQQGVGAFLKVFDDIKLRDHASLLFSAQDLPAIVTIDKDEFNKRVAEHETNE